MFRTLQNKKIENIVDYVRVYLNEHKGKDIELIVGCDSQNYGRKTSYVTVIVFYETGHGGHIIYERNNTERERVRAVRLMNEVMKSIEVAETLRLAGLPKVKYIDIDVNSNPSRGSNEVFQSAVGLVKGMGYDCRYKTLGSASAAVTYCADHIVKH